MSKLFNTTLSKKEKNSLRYKHFKGNNKEGKCWN